MHPRTRAADRGDDGDSRAVNTKGPSELRYRARNFTTSGRGDAFDDFAIQQRGRLRDGATLHATTREIRPPGS